MESEKVKEIKKALEDNKTDHLPYIDGRKCKFVDYADILTLINGLERENEKLLNEKWDKEDDLDNYHEENQQLKDRIAELEKENANLLQVINDLENIDTKLQNTCAICEAELKQFAEMLRGKAIRRQEFIGELAIDDVEYVKIQDVDETLKEFINGKV